MEIMTTGGVSGEGEGGRDGEREGGHRKWRMLSLTSCLLLRPGDSGRWVGEGGKRVRDGRSPPLRKRRRQQQIMADSGSEDGGVSPSSDDDDVVSTAGDVVASCRQLPDASTLDYERRLQKIATTGVVQLFNAVSQHSKQLQTQVKAAAGTSQKKKAKVLSTIDKGSFLDMLKGRKSEEKKWPVLKEDFMMKAKMRDWGKEEEEVEGEGEKDSSSESETD
ncbi:RRP15-like protein [Geodia barretti]|uniref:RRP15-like protein n=1 Tax=Geodia barretti TaxID=519541 RepID=A0AA35SMZ4_GEOBA|nr:RRP15-like protein [Geodia barretti]